MNRLFSLINTLILSFTISSAWAQALGEASVIPPVIGVGEYQGRAQGANVQVDKYPLNSALTYPLAALRSEWQTQTARTSDEAAIYVFTKEETGTVHARRSVKKAFLFSAILPGAGELYNRSYLSALAFVGIEVGAWVLHAKYNNRGNELTDEFEFYADTHWSEVRYWDSLARDSGGKCSENDRACLKDYERDSFSHFLPDSKNQTYYENIGKYDQFNAGWDDSKSGDARQRDSENREAYTFMRLEANKQFKNATRATTVILVNHLLSAVHAAYSTHRYNQQLKTSVGMKMEKHNEELLPTLSVSLAW